MKRLVFTICLMALFVGSCRTYWYQSNKSFEQCWQDSKECMRYAERHEYGTDTPNQYRQRMRAKGYRALSEKQFSKQVTKNALSFWDQYTEVYLCFPEIKVQQADMYYTYFYVTGE